MSRENDDYGGKEEKYKRKRERERVEKDGG